MQTSGLFTDLYELTMAESYLKEGREKEIATFDLFIRRLPEKRNYLVFAGLLAIIEYLQNLHFKRADLNYLASLNCFSDQSLDYLKDFKFSGDVDALKEGEIFFAGEPILRITAPLIEAQIIETALINIIQAYSLIASKASRVIQAAKNKMVVDFGARRSQGIDASLAAAYSAYLVGAVGTSNVLAGEQFGIPVFGTMAHSFIQSFDQEEEAFNSYIKAFPNNTTLLIDTYDTIEGAKKVVKVAKKLQNRINAVRIDSGNIGSLSKAVRRILDKGGLQETKILISGDLDEYKIAKLENQNLPIDGYGVGTRMDVSSDAPFLDTVYKLSQIESKGKISHKMKLSPAKQNLPGRKQVVRIFDKGLAKKDIISLEEEKQVGEPLLNNIMKKGQSIYQKQSWEDLRDNFRNRLRQFSSFVNYPVEISPKLSILLKKLAA
ncbi:nicotinate phosphoribosyltransferase [Candidatus Daviesbacteria bacterium]|nr:nicotinate phosphoribosyltransferase [Candidatus Daviesbacteria bacterium]